MSLDTACLAQEWESVVLAAEYLPICNAFCTQANGSGAQQSNSVLLCSTLPQQNTSIGLECIAVCTFLLTVNYGLETTVLAPGITLFPIKMHTWRFV